MRKLFLIVLSSFLIFMPLVSAIPDAPPVVWLSGVSLPPFDNDGVITVNWDPVGNEEITRYNIYTSEPGMGEKFLVGSNTTATTFIFSGYPDGNYTFYVTAVNTLDEEGPSTASEWVLEMRSTPRIDLVDPTPADNSYTRNNWTAISGYVYDGFLDTWKVNWNGADTIYTYPSGTLWMITYELPSPGVYTYYIWANNSAGNSIKTETRTLTYDITPPSVSITAPQEDTTYNTFTIPLEYSAEDSSGVSCWYEYNFVNTTLFNCGNTSFNPIIGNTTTLTVWVRDSAGNLNSDSVSFSTDMPPEPNIVSTVPENNEVLEAPLMSGVYEGYMSVKTDKPATCKYSLTPNTSFASMENIFSDIGNNTQRFYVYFNDNTTYDYYIKCQSSEGIINADDYLLHYSTAVPGSIIVFDPSSNVLKNKAMTISALVDRQTYFNVPVKSRANYSMSGFGINSTDTLIARASPPDTIPPGLSEMSFLTTPTGEGTFNATITLIVGNNLDSFLVNVIAYNDFISEFDALDAQNFNLSGEIENLRAKGMNVDDLTAKYETINTDINDSRSLYNNQKYTEAKENVAKIQESLAALENDISKAESGSLLSLPDSDSGSGGISLTTIVIVIIVVIVIIIIATSYVPDKNEEHAPAPAPSEQPANPPDSSNPY